MTPGMEGMWRENYTYMYGRCIVLREGGVGGHQLRQ